MQTNTYHLYKPSVVRIALDRVKSYIGEMDLNMGKNLERSVNFIRKEVKLQLSLARADWYKVKTFYVSSYKRLKHKIKARRKGAVTGTKGEVALQSSLYRKFALGFAFAGLIMFGVAYAPSGWYYLSSKLGIERNTKVIAETVRSAETVGVSPHKVNIYQPVQDPSLSQEPRLIIPSVGIDTRIYEATDQNFEEALKKGVWRVNNFGTPYEREKPIILAAHRFGYLKWSIPYRLKNSFYNLPKTEVGDTVEIVWNQRKYTFAIYAEEEGKEISDYSADLILYTCKDLESDVRVFKYARMLEI